MDVNISGGGKFKFKSYSGNMNKAADVFKNQIYSDIENIDYSSIDVNEINGDNEFNMEEKNDEAEWYQKALGTGAVVGTSVASGVVKIVERIGDGLVWASGSIASAVLRLFNKDELAEKVENSVMNITAIDCVGAANSVFYEETTLGNWLNEGSKIKYDSDTARKIQDVTTKVSVAALATVATVASGGTSAPLTAALFAAGFAYGAGESAEKKFSDVENRNFWKDSIEISIDGTLKGLSMVSYGKAGAAAYTGAKTIIGNGLSSTVKETIKAFNKNAIKYTIKNNGKNIVKNAAISTLYDADTLSETGTVLLEDVKNGIKTDDWNITSMINKAILIYGENFIGNLAGGIAADSIKKIDRIIELYDEGQEMAKGAYNQTFKSYREHADKHVYYVTAYMQELSKNVSDIDIDETLFAALSHDLGMKGGYIKYNGNFIKVDEISDLSLDEVGNFVRKNHPLNSALMVLTDDIIPEGMDKDVVSLLALSHSKSTSGIVSFDDPSQWKGCVDDLESVLKKYNFDNKTNFELDSKKLYDMIDDPVSFERLQKEALIVRDGDAMSRVATVDGKTVLQTSNLSEVSNNKPRVSFNDAVMSETEELSSLTDVLVSPDGQKLPNGDLSSAVKFHAGELNTSFSSKTDGINFYEASVQFMDPNQIPNSSFFSIAERIGEANTYTNCRSRKFIIELPKDSKGTSLGNWYEEQISDYVDRLRFGVDKKGNRTGIDLLFADKKISKEKYDRQIKFYESIKIEWR